MPDTGGSEPVEPVEGRMALDADPGLERHWLGNISGPGPNP